MAESEDKSKEKIELSDIYELEKYKDKLVEILNRYI